MKIVELQAENFKRLKAVSIKPTDKGLVIISGKNGQGKSSAVDSIIAALAGKDALRDTPKPIRDGEKTAQVVLDTGEYKITRRFWLPDKTDLLVESKDGALKTPQTLLDKIYDDLALDPSEFLKASEKEQRNMFARAIGFDLDAWETDRNVAFAQRTAINREIKAAEGHLVSLPKPEKDLPEEELSTADVLRDMRGAQQRQTEINAKKNDLTILSANLTRIIDNLTSVDRQIEVLKKQKSSLESEKKSIENVTVKIQKELAAVVAPDMEIFNERIAEVEAINKKVQVARDYRAALANYNQLKGESEALTFKIQRLDIRLQTFIENTTLPVPGLSFSPVGLEFNGQPFTQAADSDRLRVAVGIAMAQNPQLRIIRIRDGNLFDSQSLELLEQMAKNEDYQVWIERVDESGQIGIVIEDGEIKS